MSKRKKPKKKLQQSLKHIIRKVFTENSESSLNHKQVCALIDVRESALRKLVYSILEDLAKTNYLKKDSYSSYKLNSSDSFYEGVLQLTQRGAGFVIVDDEKIADIFIHEKSLNHGIGGDLVKVQVTKRGKSRFEGEIVEIITRERTQFVGTIQMNENFAFLVPDNSKIGTDLYIQKEKLKGAKNGDKAIAKITVWPKSAQNPYGEVIEVLGNSGGNDTEMISILVNQGLDYKFPDNVLSEAEKIHLELDPKEVSKRKDFRNVTTFTIDPLDAKDFDDALSFQRLENGNIEVGIHIADVSHYVTPGSAMDVEALKRSNSVYLVDRVIPMLPEQLSNLVCSLRPNEDKFSFSAVVEIDESGKVYNQWFGKTVIHSNKRYTYEQAQEIIEGGSGDFRDEILVLDKIAKVLRKKRLNNGAMNIESEEVRFKLDDDGFPIDVIIKTSKDAHKLIEEFMLLANRKVATFVSGEKKGDKKTPFVYRCHDYPNPEKIAMFTLFIKKFGYEIDVTDPNKISKNINALLADIRQTNEFSLVQSMAIRSMAKATYETKNIGHYGLAFKNYTHFTSPIRRYADLVVHRIVQEELTTKKHRYGNELNDICKRISRMERKAVEAERESTKYFQTLFMVEHIGEEFAGTISGIAEFGMFVRMDDSKCEGMIPIHDIPGDKFRYNADKLVIVGSKTKKTYSFGDKVKVRVYEVSTKKRQINLELVLD
ncbi:MAG: ribonuclease R [Fluviicola sp.]|nr:ribonuclease R [Fluviicola sp.]